MCVIVDKFIIIEVIGPHLPHAVKFISYEIALSWMICQHYSGDDLVLSGTEPLPVQMDESM